MIQMETEKKPIYDVGYWEYIYELEQKPYLRLIEKKARYVKELEKIDLFGNPQQQAEKVFKQIKRIEEELNIMYGMKLFMDEMKNCYLDSSEKIYDTYHSKNLALEVENHRLKQMIGFEMPNSQSFQQITNRYLKIVSA